MLPRDLLVKILSHLGTPRDVAACARTCRYFANAASAPKLWHEMAVRKYGEQVTNATIHLYNGSWKDMLADDNTRGALPTLKLLRPCFWKYNRMERFYCCLVTDIQWDRLSHKLRVYLDVRGEHDLRHPGTSSMRLRHIGEKLTFRAESWNQDTGRNGHFKGCLVFDERTFQSDFSTYNFCYANWSHLTGDYESIAFLQNRIDTFPFDYYTLNVSIFENDTPEIERDRWRGVVPEGVLERQDWWV